MSEKEESAEIEITIPSGGGKEKVGDLLRKERLTRRITVETIAKDLKLNVGYIKALEGSDFASLPPEPYARVYIKSLSKYLSLDTEAVLREFDRERGVISDIYEDKTANKIDVSVQRQDKNPTFVVAMILIVILAVFAFIANQKGWLAGFEETAVADTQTADTTLSLDSAAAAQRMSEDSALAAMNEPHDSTSAAKAPPKP